MSRRTGMGRRIFLTGLGLGVSGLLLEGSSAAGLFCRRRRRVQQTFVQRVDNENAVAPCECEGSVVRSARGVAGLCNSVEPVKDMTSYAHVCNLSFIDTQTNHNWIYTGYLVNRMVGNTMVNRVIMTAYIPNGTSSVTITPASLGAANKPLGEIQVSSLAYRFGKRIAYILLPDTTLVDRIAAKYVPSLVSSKPFGVGDPNYFNNRVFMIGYGSDQDTFIPYTNYNFSGHDNPPTSYDDTSMQIADGWPNLQGAPIFALGNLPNGFLANTLVGILYDYSDYNRCIVKGFRITQNELDELVNIQKSG